MPTSVKIIKHSTNWLNKELVTWVLEYPRYVHAELMTHRVFSKNSASSRAIPYSKMVQNIRDNMVMPIWTENKAGMQGDIITNPLQLEKANDIWKEAFNAILKYTYNLHDFVRIHKQNVNRVLEPWMHIKVILTGTDFDNWYALRAHKDAQPEIQQLAHMMKNAHEESIPTYLEPGEWHCPFDDIITPLKTGDYEWKELLKTSVARCARISYNNVDGSTSAVEKDIKLFDKLIVSEPLHASPAEHQARVPERKELYHMNSHWFIANETSIPIWHRGKYVSNLNGWIQLRKVIEAKEF